MKFDTSKSVVDSEFGKLTKVNIAIESMEQVPQVCGFLSAGTEHLYAARDNRSMDDIAIDHHKTASDCKHTFGYTDCCIENAKYLKEIAGLILSRGSVENSMRLYITDRTDLAHPLFQNKFCFLLGSLGDKKLDIYLGNSIYSYMPMCTLGCILDALLTTEGDVTVHVCGRCGMPETMMWLHSKNKCITQYGSLYLSGVGRILEQFPMWREYYEQIFLKAKVLGLITDEDVVDLMTTNNLIYISATDTLAVLNS